MTPGEVTVDRSDSGGRDVGQRPDSGPGSEGTRGAEGTRDAAAPDALFGSTRGWALADDIVHTNHGSFGGITLATRDAVTAARDRVAANPMEFFVREFPAAQQRAVAAVARLVGARAGDTTLVPNATIGMDVALRILPWGPDATIVATDQAYPSVTANLHRRGRRSGAVVEVVAVDPMRPGDVLDRLGDAIDRARRRGPAGLVVDQVASATAMPFPVHDLVSMAHARDVVVVVDGAHVPGQFAPGAAQPAADAWTGNLHKWACAPPSLAALVVAQRHHDVVGSVVASWYDDLDFPANSSWQGTSDPGPMLVAEQVVEQALAILARGNEIEARAVAGADHVAGEVGGCVLPGRGWMRTIRLPEAAAAGARSVTDLDARARDLEQPLWQQGIEAKVTPFAGDLLLRISCHAYTVARDHDRLAAGLVDVLGR